MAEERIKEPEDRSRETSQQKWKDKKRFKKKEQNNQHQWDNFKSITCSENAKQDKHQQMYT